jgi:hypothetical protein
MAITPATAAAIQHWPIRIALNFRWVIELAQPLWK